MNDVEIIVFFFFVIIGSFISVKIYRWLVKGIVRRKTERRATKYGKFYSSASEKIVIKR